MLPTQQDRRWVERRIEAFQPLPAVFIAPVGPLMLPNLVHHIQWQTPRDCWPAVKEEMEEIASQPHMAKYLATVAKSIGAG